MTILSLHEMSEDDIKKIEDILRESNCPHESLTNTFPNYTGIFGTVIAFDGLDPKKYVDDSPQD